MNIELHKCNRLCILCFIFNNSIYRFWFKNNICVLSEVLGLFRLSVRICPDLGKKFFHTRHWCCNSAYTLYYIIVFSILPPTSCWLKCEYVCTSMSPAVVEVNKVDQTVLTNLQTAVLPLFVYLFVSDENRHWLHASILDSVFQNARSFFMLASWGVAWVMNWFQNVTAILNCQYKKIMKFFQLKIYHLIHLCKFSSWKFAAMVPHKFNKYH